MRMARIFTALFFSLALCVSGALQPTEDLRTGECSCCEDGDSRCPCGSGAGCHDSCPAPCCSFFQAAIGETGGEDLGPPCGSPTGWGLSDTGAEARGERPEIPPPR